MYDLMAHKPFNVLSLGKGEFNYFVGVMSENRTYCVHKVPERISARYYHIG